MQPLVYTVAASKVHAFAASNSHAATQRRRATSRASAAREVELEPPRYSELTPKQLLDKFMTHPHLEQLDVQHHIHYLDSRFPKSPLGPVGLQAAHGALKVELEALRVENRALVAENERLRCSGGGGG